MISIIGAGPSGSYAAYCLAKKGYDVDLYEDNLEIGKPVQCTGLTTSVLSDQIKLKKDVVMNKIKHAKIIAPNDGSVTITMKEPNLVLSRCGFDQMVGDMAHDAGASLFLGHRFEHADMNEMRFKVKNENKTYKRFGELIVGADGPNTTVGRNFGLVKKHDVMYGAQASVKMPDMNVDTLEFYPFPEGYGWVVPEGDSICRVGVAVYGNTNTHFNKLLKRRCGGMKVLEYQGGIIPKYNPKLSTYDRKKNVMLLGDAATQVKWTTGGGIIQGLIAAKCVAKAVLTKQNYQTLWKRELHKDLWMHLKVRNMMDKFSPEDYDRLIKLSGQDKIKKILGEHDRDFIMSFMFKALLKEPRYLLFLKNLLRK